ncbi:hypothetical protein HRI_000086800 [Hibiscus trionum]|uniref:RNase H type-1 domain-containing protein n=1 Tax=Hibiscus trionum TaxID=183268 RepID=A0A9W7LI12_HIBTR|nr:hypothetical protein HRI_000086800 [Hibiscus trionum]
MLQTMGSTFSVSATVPKTATGQTLHWLLPPSGWHKLNVDGIYSRSTESVACGGVICNDSENWVLGYSRRIGVCTTLEAKFWGLFKGILVQNDRNCLLLKNKVGMAFSPNWGKEANNGNVVLPHVGNSPKLNVGMRFQKRLFPLVMIFSANQTSLEAL